MCSVQEVQAAEGCSSLAADMTGAGPHPFTAAMGRSAAMQQLAGCTFIRLVCKAGPKVMSPGVSVARGRTLLQ